MTIPVVNVQRNHRLAVGVRVKLRYGVRVSIRHHQHIRAFRVHLIRATVNASCVNKSLISTSAHALYIIM